MYEQRTEWDRRSIEIRPGWHAVVQELSVQTGVSLKYLYTMAVDRLLTKVDIERMTKEAWDLQRDTKRDLAAVAARHTPDSIPKRLQGKDAGSRRKKKS